METHDYPVSVQWIWGKEGVAESPDGLEPLPVGSPPEFGGEPGVWTPEHLLVAAAASCLMTTFLTVAELSKLRVLSYESSARGTLTRGEDRRYSFTRIELRPRVVVAREEDTARAVRLLEKAEAACLVARSLRAEMVLVPQVEVALPELVVAG
jgi:organic hydroperoxide reductase OsmC/OhrA